MKVQAFSNWDYECFDRWLNRVIVLLIVVVFGMALTKVRLGPPAVIPGGSLPVSDVQVTDTPKVVKCQRLKDAYSYMNYCAPAEWDSNPGPVVCPDRMPSLVTSEPASWGLAKSQRIGYLKRLVDLGCNIEDGFTIETYPGVRQRAPAPQEDELLEIVK